MSVLNVSPVERRRLLFNSIDGLRAKWDRTERVSIEDSRLLDSYVAEVREINNLIAKTRDGVHYRAFEMYLRHGDRELNPELLAALKETRATLGVEGPSGGAYPGSGGGYFSPLSFVDQVAEEMKYFGPMLSPDVVTVIDEPGVRFSPRAFPEDSDATISGEVLNDEGLQVSTQDVPINQVILGQGLKVSSKMVVVSMESAQDTKFDLTAYLARKFSLRISRTQAPYMTTGAGPTSAQPQGFLPLISGNATLALGSGDTETGAPGLIGLQDVCALEASLDPAWRVGASFMCPSSTLSALRQIKDEQKRPIFPEFNDANGPRLLNYPLIINNDLPALPAVSNSPAVTYNGVLVFGNFKKYVVRRGPLVVLRADKERFVINGQIGYVAFSRYHGSLVDGGDANNRAISCLKIVY